MKVLVINMKVDELITILSSLPDDLKIEVSVSGFWPCNATPKEVIKLLNEEIPLRKHNLVEFDERHEAFFTEFSLKHWYSFKICIGIDKNARNN